MRFALVIAAVGLVLALGSCDFNEAWEAYCEHPGRCAVLDGNITVGTVGSRQIAQGDQATYEATLHGSYLYDATVSVVPPNADVTLVSSGRDSIVLRVKVNHGADAGNVNLTIDFSEETDPITVAPFIQVTPIVVATTGNNGSGLGTYDHPYATLARANEHAGAGDTINVLAGQYASIYPTGSTACAAPDAGLKSGVRVVGASQSSTIIMGDVADAGTCAFNLSDPGQAISQLTIQNFPTGILTTAMAGSNRATVSDVVIRDCTNGVSAFGGSRLLLQDVRFERSRGPTQSGLMVDGGDVTMRRGTIVSMDGPGIEMIGIGGVAVLENVNVDKSGGSNVATPPMNEAERLAGSAIVLTSDGGSLTIDGGLVSLTRYDGIAVHGFRNTVEIDGLTITSDKAYSAGIAILGSREARVRLKNTRLSGNSQATGIYVGGDFAEFNGGHDGGTWGDNFLGDLAQHGTEILDVRPTQGTSMTFERTTVRGVTPPTGQIVDGGASGAALGIQIQGPNLIQF